MWMLVSNIMHYGITSTLFIYCVKHSTCFRRSMQHSLVLSHILYESHMLWLACFMRIYYIWITYHVIHILCPYAMLLPCIIMQCYHAMLLCIIMQCHHEMLSCILCQHALFIFCAYQFYNLSHTTYESHTTLSIFYVHNIWTYMESSTADYAINIWRFRGRGSSPVKYAAYRTAGASASASEFLYSIYIRYTAVCARH